MKNNNHHPPSYTTYHVDLPLTSLYIMEAGSGPPLIVVPATISEVENWVDLIQFMAQWFRVYFFELPGHGRSTPFKQKFSTHLVAQTVQDLVDYIGAERFNLMGFSFGGILAMRTFNLLNQRIDRLILNAPCLTKHAILLSGIQKLALRSGNNCTANLQK
jgi:pimeloyl-ACP methyl ester carboxylesterase